ncbi:MAG TPA: SurA N-terminal domain-containing protein [Mariprofundaceae bacterium]|nr:SurA N-terminal domain-containing protein [Mariprofundaceae bacterium]
MLETMRNQAQSWLAKLILGGIALSFVLWGIGDYFLGGRIEPIAEIDGQQIEAGEFYQAYERQLNSYRSMLGKQFNKDMIASLGIKESTLQTLINRRLMLDAAHDLHLTAPESVVFASISSNPAFQEASGFDPQRYRILTRNMGYASAQDYENELRLNVMVDGLQKAIMDSARVSDREIRDRFNSEYQQRELAAIIVDPDTLLDKVSVDEAAAKAWYESHKNNYRSPLRIGLNVVDINPADIAKDLSVDDADIKAAYEERKSSFSEPEERRAQQILITVNNDATDAAREEARKKIEAALARIKGGESFEQVAKAMSEDSNAEKGGDLGWFKQGTMVPEFDLTAFAMKKGAISDIIETQFGYHLIHLTDIKPARVKPLAEVREQIRADLLNAQARDEAYKLSQSLDDALGQEDSLKAAAESLNMKVHTIQPVSQHEAVAEPLLADARIRNKAFSTLPGQPVDIEESSDGHFIALQVTQRIEPDTLPFAQVAKQVMDDARRAAAHTKALQMAEEIRQSSGTRSMDVLAQKYGQAKYVSKPVRKNGAGDNAAWLTPDVLQRAFVTAPSTWVDTSFDVPQGIAVVRVEKVIDAAESEFEAQKEALRKEVLRSKGAVRFARWMASLRDQHEIITHPGALDRF